MSPFDDEQRPRPPFWWPILWLWEFLVYHVTLPWFWVRYRIRRIRRRWDAFSEDHAIASAAMARILYTVSAPVWVLAFAIRRLVRRVRINARERHLLGNLIVLLFIAAYFCGSTILATVVLTRPVDVYANVYARQSMLALERRDFVAARLFAERVIEMRGETADNLYQLAITEDALGNESRAMHLLGRIAHPNRAGLPEAHYRQASRILEQATVSLADYQLAKAHLLQGLASAPNHAPINALLGRVYFSEQEWGLAEKHLSIAAAALPDVQLDLAKSLALLGKPDDAKRAGELARQYYAAAVERSPTNVRLRMGLAESLAFLREYQDAIQVLRQGLTLGDVPEFHAGIARILTAWSDTLPPESLERRLEMLRQALGENPQEPLVFDRLMPLLRDENTAATTREELLRLVTMGRTPSLVHLLLGTDALLRGEMAAAERHLTIAWQSDPASVVAANNLAWFLAHKENPKLDEALQLINEVLKAHPDNGHFLDTRGHILAKLGKWRECIVDLEAGMATLGGLSATHRVLAEAYRQLGMDDVANRHDRLAREKESSTSKP